MNQSKLVLGFRGGMTDENDDFYSRRIMTDVSAAARIRDFL